MLGCSHLVCFLYFHHLLVHLLGTLSDVLLGVALLDRDVTARLANLRQHHRGDPELESLSTFKLGAHHQGVEAALGDEEQLSLLEFSLADSLSIYDWCSYVTFC